MKREKPKCDPAKDDFRPPIYPRGATSSCTAFHGSQELNLLSPCSAVVRWSLFCFCNLSIFLPLPFLLNLLGSDCKMSGRTRSQGSRDRRASAAEDQAHSPSSFQPKKEKAFLIAASVISFLPFIGPFVGTLLLAWTHSSKAWSKTIAHLYVGATVVFASRNLSIFFWRELMRSLPL